MLTAQLLALFRRSVFDQAEPFIWSNTDILRFIDEAQKQFVRMTTGFPDVIFINYRAFLLYVDIPLYVLDIRKVFDITDAKNQRELCLFNLDDDAANFESSGIPTGLVLGEYKRRMRLFPMPETNGKLRVNVYRLPKCNVTDIAVELEIDEEHHQYLLFWMKYLAYFDRDPETNNQNRSEFNRGAFEDYTRSAKRQEERLRHKTRIVQYGGY